MSRQRTTYFIFVVVLNLFLAAAVPVQEDQSNEERAKRADIYGGSPYYKGGLGALYSGVSNGYNLGGGHNIESGVGHLGLGNGIYGGRPMYQHYGAGASHAAGYGGGYGPVGISQSALHLSAQNIPHYRSSDSDMGVDDSLNILSINDGRTSYGGYSDGQIGGGYGHVGGGYGHVGGGYGHVGGGQVGGGYGHIQGGYGHVGGGHVGGGYGHAQALGVFSHPLSGYAVPFLLTCQPKLVQGSLNKGYGSHPQGYDSHAGSVGSHAYRTSDWESQAMSEKAEEENNNQKP